MSVDGMDEDVKIEELRAALLQMESQAPVKAGEEIKKIEKQPLPKEVQKLKAPEVPEQVRRVSSIVAAIHHRGEERARLVSDKLRREVQIDREIVEAKRSVEELVKFIEEEATLKIAKARAALEAGVSACAKELAERNDLIHDIDHSLEQLRKQLQAELAKLGAKVTA